jgi:hypothetical protein
MSNTWVKSQFEADSVVPVASIGKVGWRWIQIRLEVGGGELRRVGQVGRIVKKSRCERPTSKLNCISQRCKKQSANTHVVSQVESILGSGWDCGDAVALGWIDRGKYCSW